VGERLVIAAGECSEPLHEMIGERIIVGTDPVDEILGSDAF